MISPDTIRGIKLKVCRNVAEMFLAIPLKYFDCRCSSTLLAMAT